MFESLDLDGINLDPTVRHSKDRLFKLALVPLGLVLLGLTVYFVSRIDVFPATVAVTNDTAGSVICYQRQKTNGHDYVQDAGKIAAGQQAKVHATSSCAVFDTTGRYLSCLVVPDDDAIKTLKASDADRSLTTETCVYPR